MQYSVIDASDGLSPRPINPIQTWTRHHAPAFMQKLRVGKVSWRVSSARYGRYKMVCMCPKDQLPPKEPSSAHMLHGFCATVS